MTKEQKNRSVDDDLADLPQEDPANPSARSNSWHPFGRAQRSAARRAVSALLELEEAGIAATAVLAWLPFGILLERKRRDEQVARKGAEDAHMAVELARQGDIVDRILAVEALESMNEGAPD